MTFDIVPDKLLSLRSIDFIDEKLKKEFGIFPVRKALGMDNVSNCESIPISAGIPPEIITKTIFKFRNISLKNHKH